MSRLGTLFWLTLATATLLAMFTVKYAVQNLETGLAQIRKETVDTRLQIHDLHAEWSYLTQPERLAALNRQFLSLTPEAPAQLEQTIADIPFRATSDEMAAETTPAAPLEALPTGPHLAGSDLAVTTVALDTPERTGPPTARPIRAAHELDQLFVQVAGGR